MSQQSMEALMAAFFLPPVESDAEYEITLRAVDEIMGSDRQAQAFDRERKLKAEYIA